jgi:hypothetical protein
MDESGSTLRTETIMRAPARFASIVAAVIVAAGMATAEAAGRCVRAGGSANMITRDLAEFMAKAALGNSIKGMGAKPVGAVKLTCKEGLPVYCRAQQKACK